jgi:glycosyltransferase involved in cell wall biosynthesis
MTTVPAIRAGLRARLPVVATVRDYWPVCYWSDLIYDPTQPRLCPACSIGMMTQCVKPRAGAAFAASWPLIPYMRANLATKRHTLARADALIAVSSTIARDLAARIPALGATTVHTIPNPVDMAALDQAFMQSTPPLSGPYVLYAGKLATNKGVQFLLPALARARVTWPLVVVGDGPLRASLEAQARQLRIDLRVQGWLDRDRVWAWMQHATMLAFPSYGPESLSRVLIEAADRGDEHGRHARHHPAPRDGSALGRPRRLRPRPPDAGRRRAAAPIARHRGPCRCSRTFRLDGRRRPHRGRLS